MSRKISSASLKNVKKKLENAIGGSKSERRKSDRVHDIEEDFTSEDTESEVGSPRSPTTPRKHKTASYTTSEEEDIVTSMQTFLVQYLGYVELKLPGFNEICETVNKLYTNAKPHLKSLERSLLTLSMDGINLRGSELEASSVGTQYKPRRILYCGVDKQHQRVFSFNYQFGQRAENIHLHVIVCRSKEDAKIIAKRLADVFKRISKELHQREKEDKAKHSEGINKLKSTTSNASIRSYSNIDYPSSPTNSVTSIDSGKDETFHMNGGTPVEQTSHMISQLSVG